MRYIEMLPYLRKIQVFSVRDIQLLDINYSSSKVSGWIKKGYISKITRGYYTLNELGTADISMIIANTIYTPSYVSLETVLHRYNIIPEYPFTISSVSTKKTSNFHTSYGNYSYNTITPKLYWGYEMHKNNGHTIYVAELEKAIIDFLYLRKQYKDREDFKGLRWNIQELDQKIDREKLKRYTSLIDSPSLTKKIHILLQLIDDRY